MCHPRENKSKDDGIDDKISNINMSKIVTLFIVSIFYRAKYAF